MYAYNDSDNAFNAIELFDEKDRCILQAGYTSSRKYKEFLLEPGERLVAIQDADEQNGSTMCYDPYFIIGRLTN